MTDRLLVFPRPARTPREGAVFKLRTTGRAALLAARDVRAMLAGEPDPALAETLTTLAEAVEGMGEALLRTADGIEAL